MKHEIGIAPLRKGLVWAIGLGAFLTLLDFWDEESSDFEAAVYFPSVFACATLSLYLVAHFLRRRPGFRGFSVAREAYTVLIAGLPTTLTVLLLDLKVSSNLKDELAAAPDEQTEIVIGAFLESYIESALVLAVLWFFLSNAGRREEPVRHQEEERSAPTVPEPDSRNLPTEQGLPDASEREDAGNGADAPAPGVALIQRFPSLQGHRIRALEAQEHYVKVYSDLGEELVLYRFADAIKDVAALDGLQVHRSFWVAREAVISAKRDGRKIRLVLQDGLEVPVSKTYRPAAEAAGLIRF